MHPLVTTLANITDEELHSRINSLTTKYFASNNPDVHNQIILYIDTYNAEVERRQAVAWQQIIDKTDKNIDKLIHIQ